MKNPIIPSALRVLVVDDNRLAADSLKALLTGWGYEARAAYDGPEALEAACPFRPHVVLLDINLPEIDGWQVAATLRKLAPTKTALLLAVTGLGGEGDLRRSLEAG